MRTVIFFIKKEIRQIIRDKGILPMIFIMPFIELMILPFASTFEVRNIKFFVVDENRTLVSQQFISKLAHNKYFNLMGYSSDFKKGNDFLVNNKVDLVVVIPQNFDKDIINHQSKIQLVINAIDQSKAGMIYYYTESIIYDFSHDENIKSNLKVSYRNWFNPSLDYKTFMIPGLIVILISLIGTFLASMNIAREKEIGTIEQLNVTPIKKWQFILGKLIPFLFLALFELSIGLFIAHFIFGIPILGSVSVIYVFAFVYLIVMLTIGLIISTFSDNQQQAMFIAWFVIMIFIFLSGLFTAIENMPLWAQYLTKFVPISYFISVIRSVMLKGSSFADLRNKFIVLVVYAIVLIFIALKRYRKID